jgi:hypothetical protein
MDIVRFQGKWYKIHPKPYEPEMQSVQVAWAMIRQPLASKDEIYIKYCDKQRKEAKVLYPSFRKDVE